MSGHTPGPWTATRVPTSIGHAWQFDPPGGCIYVDDGGAEERDAKTAEADARLIAAAPDLLDALENLYALVRGECPSVLEDDHHDDMVRAAIAKARGSE